LENLKAGLDENNHDRDNRLKLIRDAHNVKQKVIHEQQTDRMEDYLEVIYELIKKRGYATQTDITESLNVSLPSEYRGINLTEEGIEVAEIFTKSMACCLNSSR
jgi:hypothetical protein